MFVKCHEIPYAIPGPIINAMLLKYTDLILKILLFLTCCECKLLSYASVVAISRVHVIHSKYTIKDRLTIACLNLLDIETEKD